MNDFSIYSKLVQYGSKIKHEYMTVNKLDTLIIKIYFYYIYLYILMQNVSIAYLYPKLI